MGRRGRAGTVLTALASALALVVGLFAAVSLVASYKAQVVEQRWERVLGSPSEILERHPRREANAAARELEALAARIGIDLATREFSDRARPERAQRSRYQALAKAMASYRTAQLERGSRVLDPPPVAVAQFLGEHEQELEAIRRQLGSGTLPRWEMDIARMIQAPVPNLLGHLDLDKLLATDALAALEAGGRERALDDLEALWTMRLALADDPHLNAQLTLLADVKLILGVLRLVEEPPSRWRERLEAWEVREPVERALGYEGWIWTRLPGEVAITSVGGAATKLLSSVAMPYLRYCMADASDEYRRGLERVDAGAGRCRGLGQQREDLELDLPRWNVVGRVVGGANFGDTLGRLTRAEIDLELTARLLALEAARRANGGRWPAEPPIETGRFAVCPAERFSYEAGAAGEMTIALRESVPRAPRPRTGIELPTRFTVR